MRHPFILICAILYLFTCPAQTVMVIPFQKKGEDKRLIMEENTLCYRFLETSLKREFLAKSLMLIDYRLTLDRLDKTIVLSKRSQRDVVTLLVQKADPDIYITADIERIQQSHRGSGRVEHKMVVNLTAHQTSDASTIAADIFDSGWRYYDECNALTTKLMMDKGLGEEPKMGEFIEQLLSGREDRTTTVEFFVDKASKYNYFTPLSDGSVLLQRIMQWLKEHSLDENLNSNISDSYLVFRSLRLTLNENSGQVSVGEIAAEFHRYLKSLSVGDEAKSPINLKVATPGDNIIFTLN